MQTFLPEADFDQTAKHLDRKRLIKQSVENLQVLKSLAGLYSSGAWKNHPAVKMWNGHEDWLFLYNESIIKEIILRGYKNTTHETFDKIYQDHFMMLESEKPWWLGEDKLHYSHKGRLHEKDPENATAKTELAYLDDPIRTNPALTHGHVKKVDQVRRTLYMAQGYYDLGKYDLAKNEYEDVLRIDPHNEAARRGMEKIAQSKSDCYRAAYGQTRAELLMQVDQAWELSIPADVPTFDPVTTRGPSQTDGVVAINAKLRNIIIPRIDFEDRTVEEAIDYLRLRAGELDVSELDPAKKGVNLVIRRPKSSLGGGLVPAEGELPAGEDLLGGGGDLGAARIDELRLRNVPLGVALTYICDKTNYRYKVRNQVVVLSPIN